MAVSIEQAVCNAVQAHLAARLQGATVSGEWPDGERALPAKAVTVLLAGKRRDTSVQVEAVGSEDIHNAVPAPLTTPEPTTLSTSIAALNDYKTTWNAHAASFGVSGAHLVVDAAHLISSPDASDLPTAITLANEARADHNAHVVSTTHHAAADAENLVTATAATNESTLIVLAAALWRAASRHYAARLYEWRVRACEQPLQLDVWATYEAVRDEVMAALEPLLSMDATAARLAADGPVREGLLVDLGDGWSGVADVYFDAPRRTDSSNAQREREWRAMYEGLADFSLTVKAQSARMARLHFRQRTSTDGGGSGPALTTTVATSPDEPGYTESSSS